GGGGGVGGGRGGGGHGRIGPAQAVVDGDVPRGGVGHHLGNDERADLGRPGLEILGVLLLVFGQSANAAADDGAAAVGVFAAKIDAAVLDGLDGRGQGKLGE